MIYGGVGPNRTLQHIIDESILIELFRNCHVTVENGFHLENRTLHHSRPNMQKTLNVLAQEFQKTGHHIIKSGRVTHYEAPDQVEVGMHLLKNAKGVSIVSTPVGIELDHEIDAEDLAVVEAPEGWEM